MKKAYKVITGFLVLLIVTLGVSGCTGKTPELRKFEDTRSLMDTYVTIIVYSDEETAGEAINAAFARMREVEKVASVFDCESEAFKLNQDGYLDEPSNEFFRLIIMSLYYDNLTGGCFDVTVQPLLDLWASGLWKDSPEVQQNKIDETMRVIGSDKINIEGNKIYFMVEGMKITLGGIAKGYAVDEAIRVLRDMGIKHALVDAGGDMGTIYSKPGAEPWCIALENPDDTSQCLATFEFSDKSVATSGNYERYFNPEKTAHHIINPKTGYSANECISVTIIAEDCMQADALATAVFVMGPEKGIRLVESLPDVECFIIDAERTTYSSSGLSRYLSER